MIFYQSKNQQARSRARHSLIEGQEHFFVVLAPLNLSLARLATTMRCLLSQSLKFKIVKIEAIAQGATV